MYYSRWNPFNQSWLNQFNQMQKEVNRLLEHWGEPRSGLNGPAFPACNLWEEEDAVHLEAELPGLNFEDLEIYVTGNNQLTIQGERQPQAPDKSAQHRRERQFGNFTRTMTLATSVDANQVDARLEHGILKIRLGKQEQAKPRKIAVKG